MILKVLYVGVVPIVLILGIVGNSLTLAVLRRHKNKNGTFYLLLSLTVADLAYMLLCIFMNFYSLCSLYVPEVTLHLQNRYLTLFLGCMFIIQLPSQISNFILLMISCERTTAVLLPLKVRSIWTKRVSLIAIAISVVMPAVVTSPRLFEYQTLAIYNNETSQYNYLLTRTSFVKENPKLYTGLNLSSIYLLYPIPVLLIMCMNTIISISLVRNTRSDIRQSATQTTADSNITRMLLSIGIFSCICMLPTTVLETYTSLDLDNHSPQYSNNVMYLISWIGQVLIIANAALNFVVYIGTSSRFRKDYVRALSTCCWRNGSNRKQPTLSTSGVLGSASSRVRMTQSKF